MSQAALSIPSRNMEPPVLRITPPSRWWAIPFGELWHGRELLYFFVWRDIKIRYKQTAIGAAWAVVQPLLAMTVFTLFFGKLAHIPSEGLPYEVFVYAGLLPWLYFAAGLQNSTNIIVENQRVITKVYFPRLILPLSSILSGLV
ncbi:MAG: ABC transporter permease, partial [Candidatus Acidiferrales bacterium]